MHLNLSEVILAQPREDAPLGLGWESSSVPYSTGARLGIGADEASFTLLRAASSRAVSFLAASNLLVAASMPLRSLRTASSSLLA